MRRRYNESVMSFNFWPSFTDICLIMTMIFILLIFCQIISNTETFKLQRIKEKQQKIETLIKAAVKKESLEDIKFSNKFEIQRIQFSDQVLFLKNSAELQESGTELLMSIGNVLQENGVLYKEIRVEGHTDKDPIRGGKYPSNWELSSARATAVVKYFDEEVGITPDSGRLSSVGFSKYVPIDSGDTEEAKAMNRRIELAIYFDAD